MGHCSRSTLPSNYIHLWDDNRNIDVSNIKGNISEELKRLGQAAWDFFVGTDDKSFGANIGKRLKFAEMNIWGEKGLSYAETICFITIDKGKLE
jgi:acyl-coenzyme A thioesterase 13